MKSDNFFRFSRFLKVCKKDILEGWKTNLLRLVTLYAVLTLYLIFTYYKIGGGYAPNKDSMFFVLFLFVVVGCIYASGIMEKMATKEKRIAYLMLPATSFEKYLSRLAYLLVFYTVAFVVVFKLADFTRMAIWACFYPLDTIHPTTFGPLFMPLMEMGQKPSGYWIIAFFISLYCFFQSFFVLGGNIWYKRPLPKTIAALLVMLIIYGKVTSWAHDYFFRGSYYSLFPAGFSTDISEIIGRFCLILMVVALFNWTLAYYRFKEAEVINRIF